MRQHTLKISRLLLWLCILTLSVTGIALFCLAPTQFDELPHPLNNVLRELHGASMTFSLIIFGFMLSEHVKKKLAKRQHEWDGYAHIATWCLLIISGILLYYPQDLFDSAGINMIQVHWYTGIALIILFPIHFFRQSIKRFFYRLRYPKNQLR